MGNIKVGRYDGIEDWTGWIEDEAASWIIYLGPDGRPAVYYPGRDSRTGAVVSPPVLL